MTAFGLVPTESREIAGSDSCALGLEGGVLG
ncbi:hypothetical protein HEB94_008986 [Actinopolymorpha pittospori]|uniref:Uncharacterized protein n=1 Tax=Actinopolymorpha pittospori TaxID=648752 RepID=A0A927RQE4_9ACTN|nr:hypothetical protein [Actinopolymorpha pittospori]